MSSKLLGIHSVTVCSYYLFCLFLILLLHGGRVPYFWLQKLSKIKETCLNLEKWYAAAVKSLQSCPTLCDPIDSSPPGSPIPGILQARTLEWVAISFSNAWKWKVKVKLLSRVWLLATLWTAVYPAPPSMGFSRQECWSGVPLPSPFLTWAKTKSVCGNQK